VADHSVRSGAGTGEENVKHPRRRQRNTKYVDPSVTPLGPPAVIGEGSTARIGKMSRNLIRAQERERAKADKHRKRN
jgi:hypothetical protein